MFKRIIAAVLAVFIGLLSFSLLAEETRDEVGARGKVLKVSGDVLVIDANGERRTVQSADEDINEMDTIITQQDGYIVMMFDDGSMSVLKEKSRLRVEKTRWLSYLGGKIYFTFKKVFADKRRVRMRSATIGVRGTTFIISDSSDDSSATGSTTGSTTGSESLALKEGLLEIESTGPAFEIHRKKLQDDFERFKRQQQAAEAQQLKEFELYKQRTAKEFIEYKRQFSLQANRVITLTGFRVDEAEMSAAQRADFESFEAEAGDLIKEFTSLSQ